MSGGNSSLTRSDTLHKDLFVEVKLRKKMAVWTLFDKTRELAKQEGKIPILALAEKGRHGSLIVIHSKDLYDVVQILGKGK